MNAISLDSIILWVNLHLRPRVVELHILLLNLPTILDSLNAFLEVVRGNGAGGDGGFGDEEDGCLGNEGGEHGARDDGLHSGD